MRPEKKYRTASRIDHTGLEITLGVWGDGYQGIAYPRPRFTWVNFSLTDAAFHQGGPYSDIARASIRDTDARLGEVLGAGRAGRACSTAPPSSSSPTTAWRSRTPTVTGDWAPALDATGIPYRDEAYMWIYTGVS